MVFESFVVDIFEEPTWWKNVLKSFSDPFSHTTEHFFQTLCYMQEMTSATEISRRKGQKIEKQSQMIMKQDEEPKQGNRISSFQNKLSTRIATLLCVLVLTWNVKIEQIKLVRIILMIWMSVRWREINGSHHSRLHMYHDVSSYFEKSHFLFDPCVYPNHNSNRAGRSHSRYEGSSMVLT